MPGTIYPSAGENNIVNTAGIQTITGPKTLLAGTVSATPLTVQGMTGQTGDIMQWKNGAGAILTRVDNAGNITAPALGMAGATYSGGFISGANSRLHIIPGDTGGMAMTIRALAGQTANLAEWQDSGGGLFGRLGPTGELSYRYLKGGNPSIAFPNLGQFEVQAESASTRAVVIRGAASQTATLTEWMNSGGTILSSMSQDGILTARSINVNNLFSGFQPVLYLTAHATQSANMTEWRNSAGTVISRVLSNGSFEMNGISSGVVAATLVNSSNLGTGAGARTYIAKIFTQTSNATGFYIDSIRASAGTDWSTADLALRRFTDATDQQSITFNGGSAQIGYNAAQHNFNSAVHATSYVTTSTRESKEDIVYLQAGAAEPRSLEGRKTSLVHNESLSNRFSKLRAVSYYPKMVVPPAEGDDALKVKPRVQRLHSFVAEEAAEIMPEIVSFDADGNPEGIDLNATSTMQTIIIQELLARVDSLETRLNAKGAV